MKTSERITLVADRIQAVLDANRTADANVTAMAELRTQISPTMGWVKCASSSENSEPWG